MRKWRPPDVLSEGELTFDHQIVVPRVYHPENLNFAHVRPSRFKQDLSQLLNICTGQC